MVALLSDAELRSATRGRLARERSSQEKFLESETARFHSGRRRGLHGAAEGIVCHTNDKIIFPRIVINHPFSWGNRPIEKGRLQ